MKMEIKMKKNNASIPGLFIVCFTVLLVLSGCQGKEQEKVQKKENKASSSKTSSDKRADYLFGKVKETMDSGGYTYLLLEFEGKEKWVAIPQMKVSVGDEVMLYPGQVMKNFHSKGLNRTFKEIIFSRGPVSPPSHSTSASNQISHPSVPRLAKKDIKISPAKGDNAVTIEKAYSLKDKLNGKKVLLKAKVVKVSRNILGKNWIHLQDGTGSEKEKNFDITVTSKDLPKIGEIVLVEGILKKDKDIGAGYFYPVLIEDATIKKAQ